VSNEIDGRLAALVPAEAGGSVYEVLALRYATRVSTRAQCFLGGERGGEGDAPLRMDYFLWLLRCAERTIVIDTGFASSAGARRGRECLVDPAAALSLAGVQPLAVEQVVITHLHYDHVGNIGAFPRASLHVHGRELDFWLRPRTEDEPSDPLVEPTELAAVEQAVRAGRVRRIENDAQIAPGVLALWTGGHTPGQMIVVASGSRSTVVLASDALHFYEELDGGVSFAVRSDERELQHGYDLLRELAARGATIVAGHDPAVLDRFPRLPGSLAELGVRVG